MGTGQVFKLHRMFKSRFKICVLLLGLFTFLYLRILYQSFNFGNFSLSYFLTQTVPYLIIIGLLLWLSLYSYQISLRYYILSNEFIIYQLSKNRFKKILWSDMRVRETNLGNYASKGSMLAPSYILLSISKPRIKISIYPTEDDNFHDELTSKFYEYHIEPVRDKDRSPF